MAQKTNEPAGDDRARHDPADHSDEDVSAADPRTPSILEQMGGISGLIYSTVPIVVFVPVNAVWGLRVAMVAALAVALVIFGVRLWRREPLNPAISGLLGVAICVFIANRVGDAKGYFLFGIWTTLAYAIAFVVSIVVRWPLIGVAWNLISGEGMAWRKHRRTLYAYDIATAFWAAVFAARYLTQSTLYDDGHTGWLAVSRIAMGWPLTALAVLATVLLVRRATRDEHVIEAEEEQKSSTDPVR
ncbi:DUF3159 domain-containing protein [Gordonia rhizosphera]|uniref:DUF3159 domain-containing protein n=1 Tax=Gordonia rhizosphera NBRC 16068 TaxID=1108045 RepID=K6WMM3_9ACTN|nr:DUF3159 domain-containing protein [Gordonia rhizosphera]GAB93367.1 hypothetical protein GORHZ_215_00120 [Gordonia rhizosphera NBRC 16068]